MLSDIQFIDIEGDIYVLRSCVKNENCFYNLMDEQISNIKENKINKLKDDVFWGGGILFLFIFLGRLMAKKFYEN